MLLCVHGADVQCNNATGFEGEERPTSTTDAGARLRHCAPGRQQCSLIQAEKEMLLNC